MKGADEQVTAALLFWPPCRHGEEKEEEELVRGIPHPGRNVSRLGHIAAAFMVNW
jgi:hypothetical protein